MKDGKNQEYISKFLSKCEEGTTLETAYVNAHTKITLKCTEGHLRQTTSNEIMSRNGGMCKECKGLTATGKKTDELVRKEFLSEGFIPIEEYKGALIPIKVRRIDCGHEFMLAPSRIFRRSNIICSICTGKRNNYTTEAMVVELASMGLSTSTEYMGMKSNIEVVNTSCGHSYIINLGHLLYDGIGKACSVCSGVGSTKARFLSILIDSNLELLEEYTTTQNSINIRNNKCQHTYKVIPNNMVNASAGIICRTCYPTDQVSRPEKEIAEFIRSIYSGWLETSDRTILGGKELDIVLPDLGIAIEYNGSRWHNESRMGELGHLQKTKAVSDFGYRLIHITDQEWLAKPDIVKSRLKSILGFSNRIFARKTEVRHIDYPYQFLMDNHIQGAGSISKYNLGLFCEGVLSAVMTFSKPRFTSGYDYELVRYCSKTGTTIVGGASKLLKAFKGENIGSIISYSDKRWSEGNLYKTIGFTFSHSSKPSYRYIKYKYSLSRYQCQKHLLQQLVPEHYDINKSESEIMAAAGYDKVFDCGTDVWTLR